MSVPSAYIMSPSLYYESQSIPRANFYTKSKSIWHKSARMGEIFEIQYSIKNLNSPWLSLSETHPYYPVFGTTSRKDVSSFEVQGPRYPEGT